MSASFKTAAFMAQSTHQVNLDALIMREDFAMKTGHAESGKSSADLKVGDLDGLYAQLLRKPDFQRETSAWGPERVANFIKSFVDGDLIPATIMWRSDLSGNVFVIDGAHRLSALLAWIHDDYGDGTKSRPFFGHEIPPAQIRKAKRTRELVDSAVGKFQLLKRLVEHPEESPDEETKLRARKAIGNTIDLQWVRGDAVDAENSFFRINTASSVIDATELDILKARNKPNAIATRALMRSGTGHKYWSSFSPEAQDEIEALAREISDGLFKPLLTTPIKTLELPIAGQPYSPTSFRMILDLVNQVNHITPGMWQTPASNRKKKTDERRLSDDTDGSATIKMLKNVRRAAQLISGKHPGSLGFHPVVYFYGSTGRFQSSAFLAAINFASELKDRGKLISFTRHRYAFEEFLVKYKDFVNQLAHRHGSRGRSAGPIKQLYWTLLKELERGVTDEAAIITALREEPSLNLLKTEQERTRTKRKRMSTDAKSAAFIREAIQVPMRCNICEARVHGQSMSVDHIQRQQDGGIGDSDNGQMTHFFCNTGYKESLRESSPAGSLSLFPR